MSKTAKYVFIVLILIGLIIFGVVIAPPKKIVDFIYLDGTIACENDQADINFAIETMKNLPAKLKPFFGDYKIIFVDEISNGASGQTILNERVIFVRIGYARAILHHELGHLLFNDYAYTDEFMEVYRSEAEILLSRYFGSADMSYFLSDSREFWCHVYYIYSFKGVEMQDVAPNTYKLIEGVVS